MTLKEIEMINYVVGRIQGISIACQEPVSDALRFTSELLLQLLELTSRDEGGI